MKRPGADQFLASVYQHYDIVIWSQTSLRWLEIKLSELGFLRPDRPYKFLCVLTKECMFRVQQRNSRGKIKKKGMHIYKENVDRSIIQDIILYPL